jgi:hypothetical protein
MKSYQRTSTSSLKISVITAIWSTACTSVQLQSYTESIQHVPYPLYRTTYMLICKVKLSLRFNLAPRHEGVLGNEHIAPRILNIGTGWRWVVSFTSQSLYPQGNSPWYPLYKSLGGAQSRSWRGGEEKNSQPLLRLEPPIIQPVARRCTTELPGSLSLTDI